VLTFRGLLESREKEGLTELYSTFVRMEKHAEGSWLSLLGADPFSSYTGIPHIRGVERNVDEAVPEEIKKKFNSTEIFILLASILCHDIGKFVNINEINPKIINPSHGQLSCMYILSKWPSLMIPREDLAKGIAIVCCSHVWDSPIRDVECPAAKFCSYQCMGNELSYLDNGLDSDDGYVRLRWLACLLRLADEVDNHLRRAVPKEFVKPKMNKDEDKESWRRHITGIIFDTSGKCIRLRTPKYLDSDWTADDKKWGRGHALREIQKVLNKWGDLLREIGLDFEKVFLDVSLPYPVLLPPTEDKDVDDISFVPEPGLDPDTFDYVRRAIRQLTNSMIGKEDYFTWEALAEESHRDVQLVRLAVNRLASIKKWKKNKYPEIVKAISNDYKKVIGDENDEKYSKKVAKKKCTQYLSDVLHIQISDFGWKIDIECNSMSLKIDSVGGDERIIPCIDVLRDLLSPDIKAEEKQKEESEKEENKLIKNVHGFCARTTPGGEWLSPIIAIEGSSGDGKSTLSLQIANKLANNNWFCLYYSLEQKSEQLLEILNGYNFFENEDQNDKSEVSRNLCEPFLNTSWHNLDSTKKKLIFPRLSPRPVRKDTSQFSIFETRYKEIQQSLEYIAKHHPEKDEPPRCFYILDSLTAFSNKPLSRSQIHRLFDLFRQYRVPLLITLERQRNWVNNQEEDHFNIARYLADILINLDSQHTGGYFHQTIEVSKSRFSRRVLGKHLMKIKSTGQKSSGKFDRRIGIAVYPSIHLHLVNSRLDDFPHGEDGTISRQKYQQFVGIDSTLLPICQKITIEKESNSDTKSELNTESHSDSKPEIDSFYGFQAGTCIAIHGAPGGHKFALAMNILMATRLDSQDFGHKLIISLAEENVIQLKSVALLENTKAEEIPKIRNHLTKIKEKSEERGSKISIQHFGMVDEKEDIPEELIEERSTVTVLNFRLGKIMPEEFLYILEEYLNGRGKTVDTILFSDTVQLRTCFPLLSQEELFLPTLVDFIKSRKLTSIFIDVHTEDGHPNEGLLAAADCRISVKKQVNEINCNQHMGGNTVPAAGNIKKTQLLLNTIQVDNILGKSYDRNVRYLVAKPNPTNNPPVLYLDESEDSAINYWCENQI
jgi:KaiC/GvpD/RAD55 family RecA-like ATPase